jgi:hypothetical protein
MGRCIRSPIFSSRTVGTSEAQPTLEHGSTGRDGRRGRLSVLWNLVARSLAPRPNSQALRNRERSSRGDARASVQADPVIGAHAADVRISSSSCERVMFSSYEASPAVPMPHVLMHRVVVSLRNGSPVGGGANCGQFTRPADHAGVRPAGQAQRSGFRTEDCLLRYRLRSGGGAGSRLRQ